MDVIIAQSGLSLGKEFPKIADNARSDDLQGQDTTIGLMGLSIVIAGMVGSVVCGVILDKSKKFKEVTLGLYLLSTLLMIVYTFVLQARSVPIIFVTTASLGKTMGLASKLPSILNCFISTESRMTPRYFANFRLFSEGFFMTGYLPIGFELSSELTYPEPESTSSGLLNASAQVFGILFTLGATKIESAYGDVYANLSLGGMLILGSIMTGESSFRSSICYH